MYAVEFPPDPVNRMRRLMGGSRYDPRVVNLPAECQQFCGAEEAIEQFEAIRAERPGSFPGLVPAVVDLYAGETYAKCRATRPEK